MNLQRTLFSAAAAAALLAAPAAVAQEMTTPEAEAPMAATPQGMESPGGAFTDAQVESFARAMGEVQSLNETMAPRAAAEADPEAQAVLRQEMNAQMTAAVEDSGLTAEEYNRMAAAAQTDPALRARIGQAMQAEAGMGADASATTSTGMETEAETPPEL